MFKKILLAFDGSEHSLRAAQKAMMLANCMQAELRVVVAHEPIPSYLGDPYFQQVITARLDASRKVMEQAKDALKGYEGELHTEILDGEVAEAVLNVADIRKSDLIVMGSRGLGTFSKMLLGSQSNKVLQHAKCPVMIVR